MLKVIAGSLNVLMTVVTVVRIACCMHMGWVEEDKSEHTKCKQNFFHNFRIQFFEHIFVNNFSNNRDVPRGRLLEVGRLADNRQEGRRICPTRKPRSCFSTNFRSFERKPKLERQILFIFKVSFCRLKKTMQ